MKRGGGGEWLAGGILSIGKLSRGILYGELPSGPFSAVTEMHPFFGCRRNSAPHHLLSQTSKQLRSVTKHKRALKNWKEHHQSQPCQQTVAWLGTKCLITLA